VGEGQERGTLEGSPALGHARGKRCIMIDAVWRKRGECWWQNEQSTHSKRLKIKPHGPPGARLWGPLSPSLSPDDANMGRL